MEFKELAKNRYSCRKMSNKKVDKALIDKIIDTAMSAPTAVNNQPYRIFVMQSEEAKKKIESVTKFTFGADTFLVVGANKNEGWVRRFDERNFCDVDASIIATHIMLEVEDLGLATTWVGSFDAPLLKELCKEMQDYDLIAIFPIGYAVDGDEPSFRHFERKSKDEVVITL